MPTTISTIENGRAKFAYDRAKEAAELNYKEYTSYVKKMPMLIKTNGLGATFSFYLSKIDPSQDQESKESKTYRLIGNHLTNYLKQSPIQPTEIRNCNNFNNLIEKILSCDSTQYRLITQDVLAFVNWLRRFSDGLIG